MKFFLRFHIVYIIFLSLISLVILSNQVSAANSSIIEYNDIKELIKDSDRCQNQDQCLGMCQCSVQVDYGGALTFKKNYTWTVYNKQENKKLFRVAGTKGALDTAWYFEANFNFNEQGCKVAFEGDQEEIKNRIQTPYVGTSCRYLEPFCCCKQSGKELFDCRRQVQYDAGNNYAALCTDLSADYKPAKLTRKGMTCKDLEVSTQPKEAPDYTSNIDLRAEAKILNKISFSSVTDIIGQIIKVLMAFIGSISLGLFVYAGILWMMAAGESERIEKAKQIILWTTLGITIMLGSYVVVNYLFGFFK